jgi:hypothetical protein
MLSGVTELVHLANTFEAGLVPVIGELALERGEVLVEDLLQLQAELVHRQANGVFAGPVEED